MWVPIDDEQCVKWMFNWYPTREIMEKTQERLRAWQPEEDYMPELPVPYGHVWPKALRANDYLVNWDVQKSARIGIAGVNLQDKCVQENQGPGPILDRRKENLCVGDKTIIRAPPHPAKCSGGAERQRRGPERRARRQYLSGPGRVDRGAQGRELGGVCEGLRHLLTGRPAGMRCTVQSLDKRYKWTRGIHHEKTDTQCFSGGAI